MADPIPFLGSYKNGMKRDYAREDMPPDSLWNIIDVLPEVLDARARKRGGYTHASQAISAVTSTADYIAAGIFAPFSAGNSILIFDDDGRAYEVESATGTENIGDAVTTRSPVFYSDKVIVPHSEGSTAPKKITRSGDTHSITAMSGSPPAGRYAIIYKDVLWLASPAASADRIFFSTAGNPEDTWDTTNKYLDSSYPITGMAALSNAVFVFGLGRTMRVRGSIPPPDSDFIVDDPIFDVGCTDNRSISLYRDKVIWANANGLYISDGSAMEDLTRICGMKSWWLDVMAGNAGFATGTPYSVSGFTISTGVYGDYLFYSISSGDPLVSHNLVDGGVIDMTRYAWYRMKNIDSHFMFRRPYPEELYFCRREEAYLGALSGVFAPSAGTKADADGTNVLPEFETAFLLGHPKLKTVRRAYVTYDIRDAGSDNPYLTLSYIDSPEETSYTTVSPTLPETSEITRVHRAINKPMRGIAFKVAQTAPSSDTRFYDLELEASEREGMK